MYNLSRIFILDTRYNISLAGKLPYVSCLVSWLGYNNKDIVIYLCFKSVSRYAYRYWHHVLCARGVKYTYTRVPYIQPVLFPLNFSHDDGLKTCCKSQTIILSFLKFIL